MKTSVPRKSAGLRAPERKIHDTRESPIARTASAWRECFAAQRRPADFLGSRIARKQSFERHGDGLQRREHSDNNVFDRRADAQEPDAQEPIAITT